MGCKGAHRPPAWELWNGGAGGWALGRARSSRSNVESEVTATFPRRCLWDWDLAEGSGNSGSENAQDLRGWIEDQRGRPGQGQQSQAVRGAQDVAWLHDWGKGSAWKWLLNNR